ETEKNKNNGNGMCSRNRQNSGMDRQYQKVIFLQDLSLCRCRAPAQNIGGRAWPWHPLPFRLQGRPKEIPDEWSETSRALRAHQPVDCATGIAAGLGAVPLSRPGTAASPGDGYRPRERRLPSVRPRTQGETGRAGADAGGAQHQWLHGEPAAPDRGERRVPAGADTERDHTPAGVVTTGGAGIPGGHLSRAPVAVPAQGYRYFPVDRPV